MEPGVASRQARSVRRRACEEAAAAVGGGRVGGGDAAEGSGVIEGVELVEHGPATRERRRGEEGQVPKHGDVSISVLHSVTLLRGEALGRGVRGTQVERIDVGRGLGVRGDGAGLAENFQSEDAPNVAV